MIDQELASDKNLVTVASRPSEVEAVILVNVLQDAGIKAVALGGFTAGFRAEAPGWVRVQTFACDAEAARGVIAELKPLSPEELDEFDREINDVNGESDLRQLANICVPVQNHITTYE